MRGHDYFKVGDVVELFNGTYARIEGINVHVDFERNHNIDSHCEFIDYKNDLLFRLFDIKRLDTPANNEPLEDLSDFVEGQVAEYRLEIALMETELAGFISPI